MLSSYIQNHNCIHCLMNKCSNKSCSNNNKNVDKKEINILSKYVNNPLLINDLENNIKKIDIKIEGYNNEDILKNGFMFTTCLFCLSKNSWNVCKNVKEGRFNKIITENNEQITYCYPELKNVKHRIQIGLHIDLKVINSKDISYKFIKNKIIENKVIENKVVKNKIIENNIVESDKNKSYLNILQNKNEINIDKNEINKDKMYENEIYQELYKNYIKLKNDYNTLQNIKVNNKNIEQIALKTQINLLNIQMNDLENILNNFNKNDEEKMDILLDNQILTNFKKIF